MVVGITGNIGSGKTYLLNYLKELGYETISSDYIVKKNMELHGPTYEDIVLNFGKEVLNIDQTINKEYLRNIIFNSQEKKELLESISHPKVILEIEKKICDYKANGKKVDKIVFVEIPLLFEISLEYLVDFIIVVTVSEDMQIKRVKKRDNLSLEEITRIISSQMSVEEKIQRSDFEIKSTEDQNKFKERVLEVIEKLEGKIRG